MEEVTDAGVWAFMAAMRPDGQMVDYQGNVKSTMVLFRKPQEGDTGPVPLDPKDRHARFAGWDKPALALKQTF